MQRAERVLAIRGVAKGQERELAAVLGRARAELESEETQLRQLRGYLDEYQGGGKNTRVVTRPALLRERRGFLRRLDEAIRQQERRVVALRARTEELAARWRESRSHLNALEKAADRLRAEQARRDARSEQAVTDETSTNMTCFSRR